MAARITLYLGSRTYHLSMCIYNILFGINQLYKKLVSSLANSLPMLVKARSQSQDLLPS